MFNNSDLNLSLLLPFGYIFRLFIKFFELTSLHLFRLFLYFCILELENIPYVYVMLDYL